MPGEIIICILVYRVRPKRRRKLQRAAPTGGLHHYSRLGGLHCSGLVGSGTTLLPPLYCIRLHTPHPTFYRKVLHSARDTTTGRTSTAFGAFPRRHLLLQANTTDRPTDRSTNQPTNQPPDPICNISVTRLITTAPLTGNNTKVPYCTVPYCRIRV